eukprot:7052802-Heterocapsa_arctica.AAC.1
MEAITALPPPLLDDLFNEMCSKRLQEQQEEDDLFFQQEHHKALATGHMEQDKDVDIYQLHHRVPRTCVGCGRGIQDHR